MMFNNNSIRFNIKNSAKIITNPVFMEGGAAMREDDLEELKDSDMREDLERLRADIDRLRSDLAILTWKSSVGKVNKKIMKRPVVSLLWAFGAGVASCALYKIYHFFKGEKHGL